MAKPDVVLMDLTMPVMDGAEATARIRDEYPQVQVVVLSGVGDSVLVEDALDAGAISYLVKDSHHEVVAQAIHDATEGRGHVDSNALAGDHGPAALRPRRRPHAARAGGARARSWRASATPRSRARLQLSTGTVRLHVGNLLDKLQAPNRTAAAVIAVENAIV